MNRFYIGEQVDRIINYNYGIDQSTKQLVAMAGYNAIEIYTLDERYTGLFIKEPVQNSNSIAVFYKYDDNHNLVVISSYNLSSYSQTILTIPEGAQRFALSYNVNNEPSLAAYTDSSFLYYTVDCNPHYKTASIQYKKENDEQFFTQELSGTITLHGTDFERVFSLGYNSEILFALFQDGYLASMNKFTLGACEIEYDLKKITLKLTAISQYDTVLKNYENEYNLIKLSPKIEKVNSKVYPIFQVYILGASALAEFSYNNNYWEKEVAEVASTKDQIQQYHFAPQMTASEFFVKFSDSVPESESTFSGILGKCSPFDNETLQDKRMYNSTREYYIAFYLMYEKGTDYNISVQDYDCINLMTGGTYKLFNRTDENWTATKARFNAYQMVIKRSSDNATVASLYDGYVCVFDYDQFAEVQDYNDAEDIYIGLTGMEFYTNSGTTVTSTNELIYQMYMRVLLGDNSYVSEAYPIPANDIVDSAPAYKYCIGVNDLGIFYCQTDTVEEATKFGINDYQQYFTSENLPVDSEYAVPVPVSRSF